MLADWGMGEKPSRAYMHSTCSLRGCCFLIKEDNILWNQADLLCVVWLHLLEIFLNHLVNMVQDSIFTYKKTHSLQDYCSCQIHNL